MNQLHDKYIRAVVDRLNPSLVNRFGSGKAALEHINEHHLIETRPDGSEAGFCYSILSEKEDGYEILPYASAFTAEVAALVAVIDRTLAQIEGLEDTTFNQKQAYVDYFIAMRTAFSETDPSKVLERWAALDTAWMKISGPIQLAHPFEYYDDDIRHSVSMESDVRIRDSKIYTSCIPAGIRSFFEQAIEENGIPKDSVVYQFSDKCLDRVQLHFCAPFSYYGARICMMPMAQVIPNENIVSFNHGKKVFAFMKQYLDQNRTKPRMRIEAEMLSDELRKRSAEIYEDKDERFYKIYDISTV